MVNDRRRYYVDNTPHAIVEGVSTLRDNDIKAWLSIMYGCDNYCTYCVVPYVRGHERSRSPEKILSEAKELIKKGYREITLLGQNVNSYGSNLNDLEKISFAQLLQKICEIEGEFRVRFMTSHPKDASDELISVMANNSKVAKQFHLPMQAGSNSVLKRMNRRYTREEYFALAMKIKEKIPGITLTTDIICGFPGETEEDFAETLDMLEKIEFDSIYSFLYSPRKGTPAAEMEEQIPEEVKSERFARLVGLQQKISEKQNAALAGKTVKVLVDTNKDENSSIASGRTEGNKVIRFAHNGNEYYGEFITLKVLYTENEGLFGEIVELQKSENESNNINLKEKENGSY
jgi:RNA modification enzyme, MiaB family